jgi:hypothetical protein
MIGSIRKLDTSREEKERLWQLREINGPNRFIAP